MRSKGMHIIAIEGEECGAPDYCIKYAANISPKKKKKKKKKKREK